MNEWINEKRRRGERQREREDTNKKFDLSHDGWWDNEEESRFPKDSCFAQTFDVILLASCFLCICPFSMYIWSTLSLLIFSYLCVFFASIFLLEKYQSVLFFLHRLSPSLFEQIPHKRRANVGWMRAHRAVIRQWSQLEDKSPIILDLLEKLRFLFFGIISIPMTMNTGNPKKRKVSFV